MMRGVCCRMSAPGPRSPRCCRSTSTSCLSTPSSLEKRKQGGCNWRCPFVGPPEAGVRGAAGLTGWRNASVARAPGSVPRSAGPCARRHRSGGRGRRPQSSCGNERWMSQARQWGPRSLSLLRQFASLPPPCLHEQVVDRLGHTSGVTPGPQLLLAQAGPFGAVRDKPLPNTLLARGSCTRPRCTRAHLLSGLTVSDWRRPIRWASPRGRWPGTSSVRL